jgi:hypothetical protein
MVMTNVSLARRMAAIFCVGALLTLVGCNGQFKLVPVSGKVTVDGQPLTHFRVSFVPDTAKGNQTPVACNGRMNEQGEYELRTQAVKNSDGGQGAPLGWYKVVVVVGLPGDPPSNVDPIFTKVDKTPFSIEVVDNPEPGHYDLKLTQAKGYQPKPQFNKSPSPVRELFEKGEVK